MCCKFENRTAEWNGSDIFSLGSLLKKYWSAYEISQEQFQIEEKASIFKDQIGKNIFCY